MPAIENRQEVWSELIESVLRDVLARREGSISALFGALMCWSDLTDL